VTACAQVLDEHAGPHGVAQTLAGDSIEDAHRIETGSGARAFPLEGLSQPCV
jgi:hypothetical protein